MWIPPCKGWGRSRAPGSHPPRVANRLRQSPRPLWKAEAVPGHNGGPALSNFAGRPTPRVGALPRLRTSKANWAGKDEQRRWLHLRRLAPASHKQAHREDPGAGEGCSIETPGAASCVKSRTNRCLWCSCTRLVCPLLSICCLLNIASVTEVGARLRAGCCGPCPSGAPLHASPGNPHPPHPTPKFYTCECA